MKKAGKLKAGKPKAAPTHPVKGDVGKKAEEPSKSSATHHPKPAAHGNVKDTTRKGSVSKPSGSHKSDASHGSLTAKHDTGRKGSVSKPGISHKSDTSHTSHSISVAKHHGASRKGSMSKSVAVKSTSDTDSSEPPLSERSETQSVSEPLLLSGHHDSHLHHQGFSMSDTSFVDSDTEEV